MLILTTPNRKGSTPVAIARERPVNVVVEPIAIATFFDCLWMLISLGVFAQECVLN